jgi:hypothetical protein
MCVVALSLFFFSAKTFDFFLCSARIQANHGSTIERRTGVWGSKRDDFLDLWIPQKKIPLPVTTKIMKIFCERDVFLRTKQILFVSPFI